ncbi:MAG: sigma-54 dependent transcriptional regulator [Ahrensia sp.]
MNTQHVVFVDDEEHLRLAAAQTFDLADIAVVPFSGAVAALGGVAHGANLVVVTDIRMPDMDGMALLDAVLGVDPDIPVIMVTGHGDVQLAVECMRRGAYDYLEKPYVPSELVATARRALEKRRLTLENRALRERSGGDSESRLMGQSPAIVHVRKQLRALAGVETDIMLIGATGTGKELAARLIHEQSTRAAMPFVHINCAALPSNLIEIELFGHEAGAFPSAIRARFGKFEYGRGGTVFLDEIDSLSVEMQAKLLHALSSRTITRLGSNDPIELDLRFIAAARADLSEAVAKGTFRDDLYYRLATTQVRLPLLRERVDDIGTLFSAFVSEYAARHGLNAPVLPDGFIAGLLGQEWPGNVRQLRGVAERFVLGIEPAMSSAQHLVPEHAGVTLAEQMAAHERALLIDRLRASGGNLKQTYEALGISRKALYEKMQKHQLLRETFIAKG